MSLLTGFDLCRAAVAVTDISAPEQSVLMVLAIMANDVAQCWPPIAGQTGLTSKTKLSERAVQNAVKALAAAGHITRDERRGKGVLYTIHPRTSCTPAQDAPAQTVRPAGGAPTPAPRAPKQPITTNTSDANASSVKSRAPRAPWPKDMPPPSGVAGDQWAGFIEHRVAKRQRLTPRAYELLTAKLSAEATDEWPPGRIVDEMVERGWLSFKMDWLTKPTGGRNGTRHHTDRRSGGWAARPGMEGAEPASLDDDDFGRAAGR